MTGLPPQEFLLVWVTAVPVVAQSAGKAAVDRAASVKSATKPKPVAEDWLVWGGKNRDFLVNASGLADSWPAAGPKKLWSRALGDGYSGIHQRAELGSLCVTCRLLVAG